MTKIWTVILFYSLLSCTSVRPEKREVILEAWKGHSTKELEDHSYFKYLPINKIKHSDGRQTWIFRDQSRYQSASYCQSLGGCLGIPFYNCDTAFSVKNDVILGAEQNGSCPPLSTIAVQKESKK